MVPFRRRCRDPNANLAAKWSPVRFGLCCWFLLTHLEAHREEVCSCGTNMQVVSSTRRLIRALAAMTASPRPSYRLPRPASCNGVCRHPGRSHYTAAAACHGALAPAPHRAYPPLSPGRSLCHASCPQDLGAVKSWGSGAIRRQCVSNWNVESPNFYREMSDRHPSDETPMGYDNNLETAKWYRFVGRPARE